MQGTAWFPVALIALSAATVILLLLLFRAKKMLRTARAGSHLPPDRSYGFTENHEYRLLAKQELFIDGTVHDFGVVEPASSAIQPYLVNINMNHIQVGDRFCFRNNSPYKVDVGNHAAVARPGARTPDPVPVAAGSRPVPSPDAPPAAAQSRSAPPPVAAKPAVPESRPVPAPAAPREAAADNALNAPPAFGLIESEDSTMNNLSHEASAALTDPMTGLAYLEVIEGPDTGTRFPLAYGESAIGRSESNAVMLSDEGASRQHCKILFRSPDFILVDAQSTNGTLCNDQSVDSHSLDFGDQIQVSDSVMVFTCHGYDLKEKNPAASIVAFERCLAIEPEFLLALKNLASLLERSPGRKKDAEPLRKTIARLESG